MEVAPHIASHEGDSKAAIALIDAENRRSCLTGKNEKLVVRSDEEPIVPFYAADLAFIAACGRDLRTDSDRCDPMTPVAAQKWEAAAHAYEEAFDAAPARRESPRAVFRLAFAFNQLGHVDHAARVFEKFLATYGDEKKLTKLQTQDPQQYDERLSFMELAYDNLRSTYLLAFDSQRAAEAAGRALRERRFKASARLDAGRNALALFTALGQRESALLTYRLALDLKPDAEMRARFDFAVADHDRAQLAKFHATSTGNPARAKFALQAAWRIAKMKQSANDLGARDWFARVVTAWTSLDKVAMVAPPYADCAAEAEYALVDALIADAKLTPSIITSSDKKLRHIIETYPSASTYVAAAFAREGALYDSVRSSIEANNAKAIAGYAQAVAIANATSADHPAITHARRRLAQLALDLGDATMTKLIDAISDFRDATRHLHYSPGEFVFVGMPLAPRADGQALPLPIAPF